MDLCPLILQKLSHLIFDPMKLLISKFLQFINVAPFNLKLETVENTENDPYVFHDSTNACVFVSKMKPY